MPLTLHSFALHRQIHARLSAIGCADYELWPVTRVHIAREAGDLRALDETAATLSCTPGFTAEWLDHAAVRKFQPRLADEVEGALLTTGQLGVDGGALTRSLARAARHYGAEVRDHAAARPIVRDRRVVAVEANGERLPCDAIVLATGPWVNDTRAWLGIDLPIDPVKGELLRLSLPAGPISHDFTWRTTALYRRGDNEIWLGTTTSETGLNAAPTDDAREQLIRMGAAILPEIARATVQAHVAAIRPMPRDGRPVATSAPGWSNVLLANGGGSKGVLLSLGIAEIVKAHVERQFNA